MRNTLFLSLLASAAFFSCTPTATPVLSGDNIMVAEGDSEQTLNYVVHLNEPAPRPVTIDYTTTGVTATAGEDFVMATGTLTIPKGEDEASITLTILGDDEVEQDETFWVSYSNGENVNVPEPFNTITLENDDSPINAADSGYTTPMTYPDYTLVWNDEFDGSELNLDDWNYETGASGWGNNEAQFYRSGTNNVALQNGKLIITAKEESFGGASYTSARITTQGKQEFQYGRVDIRAKLPYGQGIWPALWMLGADIGQVGWPACGETDIMELIGHEPHKVHGTIHWGPQGSSTSQYLTGTYTLANGDFSDKYHVFSLVWEQDVLKFYVDDNVYHTVSKQNVGTSLWRHNHPFFFIMNVAVGGNWPGYPDATTQFPQYMLVDYIRVFQ